MGNNDVIACLGIFKIPALHKSREISDHAMTAQRNIKYITSMATPEKTTYGDINLRSLKE